MPGGICLFCEACDRAAQLLPGGEAAAWLEVAAAALGELIASGQVHIVQTMNGGLGVCQNSLDKK